MRGQTLNLRIILKVLGSLLLIETFFLLVSLIVSLVYDESDTKSFLLTTAIAVLTGIVFRLLSLKSDTALGKREGYIIVSLVWVLFSAVGALPFYLSHAIPSYTDAFFETMSGFTTTGASILNDIEALPHGLLFWRSIIQWMGGMGIIVMSLAIMPILGIGGMQLFIAEVPGPVPDKLHPRIKETAKRLWGIYMLFTALLALLLLFGGMSFFDAINHAFTTLATGGYSTKQASIAHYDSAYIQYVIAVFMFIAGVNFTLSYWGLKLKFSKIWKNEEFRYYFGFTVVFTVIISITLFVTEQTSAEKAFRDAFFQVTSLMTTTGFATADYLKWVPFLGVIAFVIMFFGGSAGSTAGGIKIMRIIVLLKNSAAEFKRLVHPNAIIPVRFNNHNIRPAVVNNILAFIVIYILTFVIGTVTMAALGYDLDTAMGAVIATLGNIGPGIGKVGPANNFAFFSDAAKWFLSFLMLVGRLEIFTVLLLFSPSFWRG